jgi:hypothetical protein
VSSLQPSAEGEIADTGSATSFEALQGRHVHSDKPRHGGDTVCTHASGSEVNVHRISSCVLFLLSSDCAMKVKQHGRFVALERLVSEPDKAALP